MPTDCSQDSFDFGTVEHRRVVGAFDGGDITSDAGAMLLGQTEKAIRLVSRLADSFQDGRSPAFTVHKLSALLSQRIFGIALGYEDIVDHDQLRHDPVLGVLGGTLTAKRSDCAPLAGKSTLNRLEHAAKVGADPYHKTMTPPRSGATPETRNIVGPAKSAYSGDGRLRLTQIRLAAPPNQVRTAEHYEKVGLVFRQFKRAFDRRD